MKRLAGALLMALAGGACFLQPTLAQTNFAVLVSDGAWTWYNDPRALFHNGILYFGYVRNGDGRSVLSALNPQTGARTEVWTSALVQRDDHCNAGLLVKQDNTMLALYSRHNTDQYFCYRLSTSTNPVTPADWAAEHTSASTGAGVTYANPYQLSAESGRIYNFMRDLNYNPTVVTSANGGSTWSAPQLLIQTGTGGTRPYVKYASDYAQRLEFLYTDGHPRNQANSLYHLYYQGGNFYKTDGTFLKSYANLPILHDSGERGSVIYQYSDVSPADPNDHIPTGRAWCWEISYQADGKPVCVFTVQRDQVTGPNWYDDRIYYYYARWTGTAWQKRFIAHAGRPLFEAEDDYAGGICVDPGNPNVVYISSNAQNPFNLSDTTNVPLRANERYELYRGVTADGGLSFTWTAVTTNSAVDNLRPYIPRRQTGTSALIWFRGIYTTYSDYDCEVVGLFPNPVPSPPTVSIISPAASLVIMTNVGNALTLKAVAADDGLPGPLSTTWTTASGPASALFSNPTGTNTTATFPLPGFYVLRLTASDTQTAVSADVMVQAGALPGDGADATRALWLKLDQSSGTTASDSSGNGNNGTLSGGAAWQPSGGMRAGALAFDGASGVVTVNDAPNLDNTSAFTLAYWFRADQYPADSAGLVSKRDGPGSNNAYTTYLKAADKRIYVDVDGSNNRFSSAAQVDLGVWYHVALVFNGALPSAQRVQLWINGQLDTTASETSAAIPDYPSNFRLGNTHSGATYWFAGRLDDVRFYRRALTASEVIGLAYMNTEPSVIAGPISSATNSLPAALTGQALDDGQGGTLSVQWRALSGPGTVVFGNSNALATSVTFNRSGAYVLRLAASDTQAEVSADLNVSVQPNLNTFEDWIAQSYPGITNAGTVGSWADPDGDGAQNLLEFALGMNPAVRDAQPFTPTRPGLPVGTIQNISGTNFLTLLVRRPFGRLAITYAAEVSPDLRLWAPGVQAAPPTSNGDGTETVVFRDTTPVSQAAMRFMRLKVLPAQ